MNNASAATEVLLLAHAWQLEKVNQVGIVVVGGERNNGGRLPFVVELLRTELFIFSATFFVVIGHYCRQITA